MPILWRYLLFHFLRVFGLVVASFVAVLFTLRLSEIAYFATLGPSVIDLLWFALQQLPYILPIAFPVSALISSFLLMQALSQSRELTAMRSSGFSLKDILAPVLAAAIFLGMLNFYIVSELSTASHLNAGQLKNQLRSINPLLLLNNKLLVHMKGLYFDTLGSSHVGEYAEDIVFLSPTHHSDRLLLMVAKRIDVNPENFSTNYMTIISGQTPNDAKENLIIENMVLSSTTIQDFSNLLEKKIWSFNNDHLQLPLLLVRQMKTYEDLKKGIENGASKEEIKSLKQDLNRTIVEIIRRISVGMVVFSFTLLGLSFGMSVGRKKSAKGVLSIALLASIYLISFFIAKSFDHAIVLASLLYLVPHALMWISSLIALKNLSRGVE